MRTSAGKPKGAKKGQIRQGIIFNSEGSLGAFFERLSIEIQVVLVRQEFQKGNFFKFSCMFLMLLRSHCP